MNLLVIGLFALVLILVVVALCLGIWLKYLQLELKQAEERAAEAETQALLKASEYLKSEEKRIRADAARRSTAVVKGRVVEQLIPFVDEFDYNPRDARFLGSPVDLIVFEGMTDGRINRIVFIEVKAGRYAGLTRREVQVREAIEMAEVDYEVLHIGGDN